MRFGMPNDGVHTWWSDAPAERFWLDVTGRDERERMLATPCGRGRSARLWAHALTTHVRAGDVVFRYDESCDAITGWSRATGGARRRDLAWRPPAEDEGRRTRILRLPSWAVALGDPVRLRSPVSLGEVAAVQWDLFPALRALEDRVGSPLYYPFEMGGRDATRPLPGYVFKLPALLVRAFPEFATALDARTHPRTTRAPERRPAPLPAPGRLATSR